MVYLDADPTVASWTYEQTIIEYVSNIRTKKIRRYYPDFCVTYSDGHVEIIEVKPKRKLTQATVKKKTDAAHAWCTERSITYKIVTEVELKELGLL